MMIDQLIRDNETHVTEIIRRVIRSTSQTSPSASAKSSQAAATSFAAAQPIGGPIVLPVSVGSIAYRRFVTRKKNKTRKKL